MRKRQDPNSSEYREAVANMKRSPRQTTPQPIRFFSDTRILDSTNDDGTCYTAGQSVTNYQGSGTYV